LNIPFPSFLLWIVSATISPFEIISEKKIVTQHFSKEKWFIQDLFFQLSRVFLEKGYKGPTSAFKSQVKVGAGRAICSRPEDSKCTKARRARVHLRPFLIMGDSGVRSQ
jgi:hypothetical protein